MKKRLLVLMLAMAMVLSLTACGSKGDDSADAESTAQTSEAEDAVSEEEAAPEETAEEEEAAPKEEEAASEEVTEEEEAAPEEEEAAMTLEEWMQSDEAKLSEEMTNSAVSSQGIKVKFLADGNIFVYEYIMPDEYATLESDVLAAAFEPVIKENEEGVADMFETFDTEYGIKLDGVRFSFVTADGTELYAEDVANK